MRRLFKNGLCACLCGALLLCSGCSCLSENISSVSGDSSDTALSETSDYVSAGSSILPTSSPTETSLPNGEQLPSELVMTNKHIYLSEGQYYALDTVVYPANALGSDLIYSTNNSEVASVSADGTVSFVALGSATVTASTVLGGCQATCTVECIQVCDSITTLYAVVVNAILDGKTEYTTYLTNREIADSLADFDNTLCASYTVTFGDMTTFAPDGEAITAHPATFTFVLSGGIAGALAARRNDTSMLGPVQLTAYEEGRAYYTKNLLAADSDFSRVKRIHDHIIASTEYDEIGEKQGDYAFSEGEPYGVLVDGLAISDGYADTFLMLCAISGIECKTVIGSVGGVRRVWNLVKLDGAWYHVDCIADIPAPGSAPGYFCFLVSDEVLAADHTWIRGSYPEARYSYGNK